MSKSWVVAVREYLAMVRTKAFILSLVLTPLIAVAAVFVIDLMKEQTDVERREVVVFDGSGKLFDDLQAAASARNEGIVDESGEAQSFPLELTRGEGELDDERTSELAARVRDGELSAFVDIGAGVLDGANGDPSSVVRIFANSPTADPAGQWVRTTVRELVRAHRIRAAGIDPAVVAHVTRSVAVERIDVRVVDRDEEERLAATIVTSVLPAGALMLIVIAVFGTMQPALNGVLEEKQQRIAEVLLGSIRPFDLMLGKLIGSTLVGLTLLGVYAGVGIGVAAYYGYADLIPVDLMVWVLVHATLGMFAYGAMFLAIGATCSELKDAQSLLTPVMLSVMFPAFVVVKIITEPLGAFATWSSLIPPFSSMMMPARLGASEAIPLWQPLVGIVLMAAFTAFVTYLAGRVFRIGILFRGQAPSLRTLAKWALRG